MDDSAVGVCDILRSRGVLTRSTTQDGDGFFKFISEEHHGKMAEHYRTRKEICELEKNNPFYFQLFLPATRQSQINLTNPPENLNNELKAMVCKGQPPTPREVFAASELLRRKIYIYDLTNQRENGYTNCTSMYLYAPIIHFERKDVNPIYLLMIRGAGKEEFFLLQHDSVKLLHEMFGNASLLNDHEHCIGNRFINDFSKLTFASLARPNCETKDIFRTLSFEMYGTYDYRELVMTSLFNFQVEDDCVEIFSKFLEDQENSSFDEKRKALLLHAEEVREERDSPGQGDIFAAASVFNVQLYLQRYMCAETELYIPLSGSYRKEFDSFLTLEEKSKKMFQRSNMIVSCCLCQQKKPEVNGTLGLLKKDIYGHLQAKTSCCPNSKRHKSHLHFKSIEGSKQDIEERVPYIMPINEVLRVLNKLESAERVLDQINGGNGTLYQCLAKEIYGNENSENSSRLQQIISECADTDTQIQSVSDWLKIPIYVLCNKTKMGYVQYGRYVWCLFEPYIANPECRYYITIYHNAANNSFDRVVPKIGCNCQVLPPLSMTGKKKGNEPRSLTMYSRVRHRPMVEFLSEQPIDDTIFQADEIELPQCPPYSEVRLAMERSDMGNRIIDKTYGQDFSLQRCISKETFGSEDSNEFVLKEMCMEIIENPELYAEKCKVKERSRSAIKDLFKRKSEVVREKQLESVKLMVEKLEDGLKSDPLELEIAATHFQTNIYVLSVNGDGSSNWHFYEPASKRNSHEPEKPESRCPDGRFYLTLYRSSAGQFHRIVPQMEECNCCLSPPEVPALKPYPHMELPVIERRMVHTARKMENSMGRVLLDLKEWFRCNKSLQRLCDSMVTEIEGRRFNVNIATITGSSVGIIGAGLAIGGLIAAPFTLGASTVLTIVGGAVGGVGGATAMGAKISENILNINTMGRLERFKRNFQEHSSRLEDSIDNLTISVEDFDQSIESFQLDRSLDTFDKSMLQSIPGLLRAVKGFSAIPLGILRFAFRGATILGAVIGPLSALLDIGFLAFSAWNLHHGSKTDVSEGLRRTAAVLLASRRQMHAWALGDEEIK